MTLKCPKLKVDANKFLLILLIFIFSCNDDPKVDSENLIPQSSETKQIDKDLNEENSSTIKDYLIGKTLYCYLLRKKYDEFDDYSIVISDVDDKYKARFSQNSVIFASTFDYKNYNMQMKINGGLIDFTDLDGFYKSSKGKIKSYNASVEENGVKLLITDESIYTKRNDHFGNMGSLVGYFFSTEENLNRLDN